jgi:hypothetical protein
MMNDEGVPVIGGMPIAEGWRSEIVLVHGRCEEVFVSPTGERYVRAGAQERADLIVHRVSARFAAPLHLRLRRKQDSALMRRLRREQRQVARGERQRVRRKRYTKVTTSESEGLCDWL